MEWFETFTIPNVLAFNQMLVLLNFESCFDILLFTIE